MILINPPVTKPCEPPAGIAKLAGALSRQGVPCRVWDANIEGLLYLLGQPSEAADTWSRRAIRNASGNIAALRQPVLYRSAARYDRAVRDLQRALAVSVRTGRGCNIKVGLADYQDPFLSPLRSSDLLQAAEHPEENPFTPLYRERLPALLKQGRTGLVGISLTYLSQALCTFALLGLIRKEHPGIKLILGGGLVSSWLQRPGWRNPFGGLVDHLVAGPGEQSLLSLLGREYGKEKEGAPDYGGLPLPDYLAPGLILPYSAASGCFWSRCSFCPEKAEANPYRPIPVGKVIEELKTLAATTRPSLLHLLDNALSPALLRALADQSPGVPWYGFARISPELAEADFCRALKKAGCVMLKLGIESGDQGVLDALDKGIDINQAAKVLHNLKEAGIATYVYLLFGTPAETLTQARQTLDFVVRHHGAIDFLNLAIFNMPLSGPESGDYETAEFYEGDLSLYTAFRHPRGWDRKHVRRFLDQEFKRHSAVSSILKHDPPVFTSNHACFMQGMFLSVPSY